MSKPKIVVVGSSNTDMIIKAERIPAPAKRSSAGPCDRLRQGPTKRLPRSTGARVFVARVGDDMLGPKRLKGTLKRN